MATKSKRHPDISALTASRLRQVARHILKEPLRYEQDQWVSEKGDETALSPCGTEACIAGWALVLDAHRRGVKYRQPRRGFDYAAGKVLGLADISTRLIWDRDEWPEEYRDAMAVLSERESYLQSARFEAMDHGKKAPSVESIRRVRLKMAKVAAKRIEHFIAYAE